MGLFGDFVAKVRGTKPSFSNEALEILATVKEPTVDQMVTVAPELAVFLKPNPSFDYEKFHREEEERKARWQAEQQANHAALIERGVVFPSESEIIRDTSELINRFCPQARKLNVSVDDDPNIYIDYKPLTKTGKLPKNVILASINKEEEINTVSDFGFEYKARGDAIISRIHYMADGTINMADFHLWKDLIHFEYRIRRDLGELKVVRATRMEM